MISHIRLYAPAIWFAIWAGVWLAGLGSELIAGVFLGVIAVLVYGAESERQRLVRKNRGRYRRRRDDP